MDNSKQVSFRGASHNANDWVNPAFPSFVIPTVDDFELVIKRNGQEEVLPPGSLFFIESWTWAPFNMEGFQMAFRVTPNLKIEFVGYEAMMVDHLEESCVAAEKLEKFWSEYWSNQSPAANQRKVVVSDGQSFWTGVIFKLE